MKRRAEETMRGKKTRRRDETRGEENREETRCGEEKRGRFEMRKEDGKPEDK